MADCAEIFFFYQFLARPFLKICNSVKNHNFPLGRKENHDFYSLLHAEKGLCSGNLRIYSSKNRADGPSRNRPVDAPTKDLPLWCQVPRLVPRQAGLSVSTLLLRPVVATSLPLNGSAFCCCWEETLNGTLARRRHASPNGPLDLPPPKLPDLGFQRARYPFLPPLPAAQAPSARS